MSIMLFSNGRLADNTNITLVKLNVDIALVGIVIG